MKSSISISLFAVLIFPATSLGQDAKNLPNAPSSRAAANASGSISDHGQRAVDPPSSSGAIDSSPTQPVQANPGWVRFQQ